MTMNRIEIKQQAKKLLVGNLWNVWQPMLVVYVAVLLLEMVAVLLEAPFFGFVIAFVSLPLSVGILAYQLALVRKKPFSLTIVFNSYKKIGLIFLTALLIWIFTVLWSFLLIIPGIIAAFSYSMSFYLLADDSYDLGQPMSIIAKSKKLMSGYKLDYFVFQLSFIGWYFLCGITLGIAAIYVVPYHLIANTIYYDQLQKLEK